MSPERPAVAAPIDARLEISDLPAGASRVLDRDLRGAGSTVGHRAQHRAGHGRVALGRRRPGARARRAGPPAGGVHGTRTGRRRRLGAAARRRLGRVHVARPGAVGAARRRAAAALAGRSTSWSVASTSRTSWSATARPGRRCSATPSRWPASPTPRCWSPARAEPGRSGWPSSSTSSIPRPSKGKLVVLDCSTVVPSLSGSEFFGHEKGAFTGASAAREGAFELANGGTLFLDEVGELPVALQAELLRVIQEGTFKRVGSNMWRKSTFRLVCATNRDVEAEQANGTFRNDFYYRIAGCTLHLPSLRRADRGHHPAVPALLPPGAPRPRTARARRRGPGPARHTGRIPATCGTCAAWCCASPTATWATAFITARRHPGAGAAGPPEQPATAWPRRWARRSVRRGSARGATLADITSAAADAAMWLAVLGAAAPADRAAVRGGDERPTLRIAAARAAGRQYSAASTADAGTAWRPRLSG